MKLNRIFIVIASTLLVFVFFLMIFNGVQVYEYSVIVGNHIGFNVDNDKIYFGTVPRGERSRRAIVVKNTDKPSKVRIRAFGDLAGNIKLSDNNFKMQKNETKEITIFMFADSHTNYGKYTGNVIFLFTRI